MTTKQQSLQAVSVYEQAAVFSRTPKRVKCDNHLLTLVLFHPEEGKGQQGKSNVIRLDEHG